MIISNEFTVTRPIDATWEILTDLEGIAPCMPGAQLTEVEGDVYRGIVKVKLGPIQAQFKGEASFEEQDPEAHRAVLSARGKEKSGKGVASATVTASLTPGEQDGTTVVSVDTELSISGKIAQFGRSAMSDVSEKLMAQFAQNLEHKLGEDSGAPAEQAPGETSADEAAATSEVGGSQSGVASTGAAPDGKEPAGAQTGRGGEPSPDGEAETAQEPLPQTEQEQAPASGDEEKESEAPQKRVIDSPEAEPVDLMRTAGAPMARWLVPAAVIIVLIVILVVVVF
jgi:uncharacterized protein